MMRTLYELTRNQALIVATRPVNIATGVVTPLMFMSLLTLPRLDDMTPTEATRVFTGVLLAAFWSASLWSGAGILRRERWFGTLAPSFTGRPGPVAVMTGKTLGGVVYDVALIFLSNTVFVLVFGIRLEIGAPGAFALGIAAVIACGVASSLLIGAVLILSRHAFQLTTAFGTPILLLGGTIIPHEVLPSWVAAIGQVINLAWLQRFLASTADRPDWAALGAALAISACYAAVGVWCLHLTLRRARKEGTLELA
ncbi:ABC transporter permease [Nesterenkonia muleiensis]|uniref:ABC transporter permease n=1 Tax=Nesterenkonia muleiensis TaxID=2282648 RepID=UPI000E7219A4|nr:ABC transporter permease [Nesterenkonia muleiensis]